MSERFDIYKVVTQKFIEALQNQMVPWQKPWDASQSAPRNFKSKKDYRGVNVWLLAMAASLKNYPTNDWLTYRQCAEMGGQVRKGEKSEMVVFWKVGDRKAKEGEVLPEGKKKSFLLRYSNVFNVAQCDGLPSVATPSEATKGRSVPVIKRAQSIVDGWNGPDIAHRSNGIAAYSPQLDFITMPHRKSFHSAEAYYHTLFHELTHSTGHKTRLDRDLSGSFGKESYSKEELIAEMGAAFLSTTAGIDVPSVMDNSQAYFVHWISKLEKDEKLVLQASSAAQKATDMILGTTFEAEEETEEDKAA